MCLILFAYQAHPCYPLLVAANRDEYYVRPTAPMAYWQDIPELLAGRDLQAGGTWLGITRSGRFAAITNFRDPRSVLPNAPSRGHLVSDFLKSRESGRAYLERLLPQGGTYNGFNLLLGDGKELLYYSNQDGAPQTLQPGIYGLSNHLLNTPWPKVERGRWMLAALLEGNAVPSPDDLLGLLQDHTRAADEALPNTGVSLAWERILSPLFIESPDYGTRSSTILCVDQQGKVTVTEKTWDDGSLRTFQLQWWY
jgi:uncharacterized protein with NRDE domain